MAVHIEPLSIPSFRSSDQSLRSPWYWLVNTIFINNIGRLELTVAVPQSSPVISLRDFPGHGNLLSFWLLNCKLFYFKLRQDRFNQSISIAYYRSIFFASFHEKYPVSTAIQVKFLLSLQGAFVFVGICLLLFVPFLDLRNWIKRRKASSHPFSRPEWSASLPFSGRRHQVKLTGGHRFSYWIFQYKLLPFVTPPYM